MADNIPVNTHVTGKPFYCRETLRDNDQNDAKNQVSPTSPNSVGWSSEPQSFLSSEPSSPGLNSGGECSMSMSLVSNDGLPALLSGQAKYSASSGLELDYTEFCMNIEQETRESRGSVSYTDYYSSEDGQIRRSVNDNCLPLFITPAHCASSSCEHSLACGNFDNDVVKDVCGANANNSQDKKIGFKDKNEDDRNYVDEENHTLTFKQARRQSQNDLQLIFKQSNNKTSASCKRIGRFRVESMDTTNSDVRIKDTNRLDSSLSFRAQSTISLSTASVIKKNCSLLRSQSVFMPKISKHIDGSNIKIITTESSVLTTSFNTDDSTHGNTLCLDHASTTTSSLLQEQPLVTTTISNSDEAHVTIGFNVDSGKPYF